MMAVGVCRYFSVLFGIILINLMSTQGLDCEILSHTPGVSRLQLIYSGCLGRTNFAPKPVVHLVCQLVKPINKFVQLDETTKEFRPIVDDVTYQFQIVKADWTITGDIINSTYGVNLDACSRKCTDEPTCLALAFRDIDKYCILSSTCIPAGNTEGGTEMYNIAHWNQD